MSLDVFASLEAIRHFLAEEIAEQVPSRLRAEVRAAGKLLRDLAREIDALPALLHAECHAMLDLCDREIAASPQFGFRLEIAHVRQQLAMPMATISGQLRLHHELTGAIEIILLDLLEQFDAAVSGSAERAAIGTRIAAINRLLGEQADARIAWQSVFPGRPAAIDPEELS